MEGQDNVSIGTQELHLLIDFLRSEEQSLGKLAALAIANGNGEAVAHIGRTAANLLQDDLGDDCTEVIFACRGNASFIVKGMIEAHGELLLIQAARCAQIGARSSETVALRSLQELVDAIPSLDRLLDVLFLHIIDLSVVNELASRFLDRRSIFLGEVKTLATRSVIVGHGVVVGNLVQQLVRRDEAPTDTEFGSCRLGIDDGIRRRHGNGAGCTNGAQALRLMQSLASAQNRHVIGGIHPLLE